MTEEQQHTAGRVSVSVAQQERMLELQPLPDMCKTISKAQIGYWRTLANLGCVAITQVACAAGTPTEQKTFVVSATLTGRALLSHIRLAGGPGDGYITVPRV